MLAYSAHPLSSSCHWYGLRYFLQPNVRLGWGLYLHDGTMGLLHKVTAHPTTRY